MTEVKLHSAEAETPTQRMAGDENRVRKVTDKTGRVIAWRPLLPLEDMDLAEIAGPENILNMRWMNYASAAFVVVQIDGEPTPKPQTKLQLRAMIQRLATHGVEAVLVALQEMQAEAKNDAAELEAAKN